MIIADKNAHVALSSLTHSLTYSEFKHWQSLKRLLWQSLKHVLLADNKVISTEKTPNPKAPEFASSEALADYVLWRC